MNKMKDFLHLSDCFMNVVLWINAGMINKIVDN